MKLALQWLEAFASSKAASFVLGPLLRFSFPSCKATPEQMQIVCHTVRWLSHWGEIVPAGYVLLAWHVAGWSEFVPNSAITEAANAWIRVNRAAGSGGPAMAIALALSPVDSPNALKTIAKAQSWVFNHKLHPSVGDVLSSLLAHCGHCKPLIGFIADAAINFAWHQRMSPVRRVLTQALSILTADDHRRQEIEVILERSR